MPKGPQGQYHPGYYSTPSAFTRDEHITNLRFRVWNAGPMRRQPTRKRLPAFLHA